LDRERAIEIAEDRERPILREADWGGRLRGQSHGVHQSWPSFED
jgi:hypothetical protein